MKKLLLLVGCMAALSLSSCLKDNTKEISKTAVAYDLYANSMGQCYLSLDAFDVAFKLNTLIVEGEGDYAKAPKGVRDTLFAQGTEIQYNQADGLYKVIFSGQTPILETDFKRMGTISINTNGYASLSEVGARWDIQLTKETPYTVTEGRLSYKCYAGTYLVTNMGTNQWNVSMSQFVSTPSTDAQNSDWNAQYTLKQLSGDQSFAGIKSSIFSLSITLVNSLPWLYAQGGDQSRINATTSVPFYINPKCKSKQAVAQGTMTIYMAADLMGQYPIKAEILGDGDTKLCKPKTRITYAGYTDDYNAR